MIKVSDNFDSYLSDESDTKTINSVVPDESLDNSASLETSHVYLDAGTVPDSESSISVKCTSK